MAFLVSHCDGRYNRQWGRLRTWLKGILLSKIREGRRRLAKAEAQVVDQTGATAFMNRVPHDQELATSFDEEWGRGISREARDRRVQRVQVRS